jgi:hypothetical protein
MKERCGMAKRCGEGTNIKLGNVAWRLKDIDGVGQHLNAGGADV